MESQNWDSIRGGLPNDLIERVLFDSVHNELLVCSKFLKQIGNLPTRGIARWNGIRWDSLAGGVDTHDKAINPNSSSTITGCIPYNGKLLVAGGFASVGGINATSLALWDGVKWDSLPKRAFRFNPAGGAGVLGVKKINNLVYIYGQFDTIAGQKATGLATWDGANFNPIMLPFTTPSLGVVADLNVFQNEIYITGGVFNTVTSGGMRDILKYNGTNWVTTTSGGLKGGFSSAGSLIIYNNELYTAGHFLVADGNLANNVMKFNGSQWQDVGFGNATNTYIEKLVVHQNKLWALGGYTKVAGMQTYCVSVYDGTKWCVLQDTVDNTVLSGIVYNDTMYIGGGFWTAGGDPHISYLAKLRYPDLYKSCNGVGITEISNHNSIKIYPHPVSKTLHIQSDEYFEPATQIEITNTIGQIVFKSTYLNEIDVSSLSNGCYFMKIIPPDKKQLHAKFVKCD